MFLVYDKNQDIVVGFYFCARLAMICGFCVYYSFAFESFPLSVAAYGYTFSATFSSIAGVIIPFIIEYIKDKYVFLIYAIEGIACAGIFFFLEEMAALLSWAWPAFFPFALTCFFARPFRYLIPL